jgi:hypothetical protein
MIRRSGLGLLESLVEFCGLLLQIRQLFIQAFHFILRPNAELLHDLDHALEAQKHDERRDLFDNITQESVYNKLGKDD